MNDKNNLKNIKQTSIPKTEEDLEYIFDDFSFEDTIQGNVSIKGEGALSNSSSDMVDVSEGEERETDKQAETTANSGEHQMDNADKSYGNESPSIASQGNNDISNEPINEAKEEKSGVNQETRNETSGENLGDQPNNSGEKENNTPDKKDSDKDGKKDDSDEKDKKKSDGDSKETDKNDSKDESTDKQKKDNPENKDNKKEEPKQDNKDSLPSENKNPQNSNYAKEDDGNKPELNQNNNANHDRDISGKDNSSNNKNSNPKDNSSSSADQKRQEAKNKQDNRQQKNRQNKSNSSNGNSGGNFKDRAKNKIKEQAVNKATEAINNNKAVQTAKKAKETIQKTKKTIKTIKSIVAAISSIGSLAFFMIFLVILIAMMIIMIFLYTPGSNGNIETESSSYSEADQKTIEKVQKIFNKYPNANGSLAMFAVVYPYESQLWGVDVLKEISLEADEKEEEDELEEDEDTEDVTSSNTVQDDIYLSYFKKYKFRSRLKKLLKKMDSNGEDAFFEYMRTDYFEKGSYGYKDIIEKAADKEKIKDYIIEDLKNNKDTFINYAYNNATCSATLIDAGDVAVDEMLKGTLLVDPKVDSCGTSDIESCESWYSSPISIGEYVKGVVWTEMSVYESINIEKVKAQMVAAKSYVLGRYKTMGWDLKQTEDGAYVLPIRSNTNDQDYCDYKEGCVNKSSGNQHGAANENQQKILEDAWQATADLYVFDSSTNATAGAYCADRNKTSNYDCSWCTKGTCLSQSEVEGLGDSESYTVETILSEHYNKLSLVTIVGDTATAQTVGAMVCSNKSSNMSATRNKIAATAMSYVGKIPYYEGGLASSKVFEENQFNTDVAADPSGRTKKGLGAVGFVNWIFWSEIDNNFGNQNDINNLINDSVSYEIAKEELLVGDIGYTEDFSSVGVYIGEEKWAYMDAVSGNLVNVPTDIFTKFRRLNEFKDEIYSFDIRDKAPTSGQWSSKSWFQSFGGNLGQCPWYAQNRASEIIENLKNNNSITENTYNTLIARIQKTSGNGIDYQPGHSAQTSGGYPGGTDLSEVKPGSFLGMSSNSSPQYGHVAVVEYVDVAKDVIIISDGWTTNSGSWSGVNFAYSGELSFSEFVSTRKFRSHTVYGYLYFLGE